MNGKKLMALLLILAMALSLAACGGSGTTDETVEDAASNEAAESGAQDTDTGEDAATEETTHVKVGLICIGDEND